MCRCRVFVALLFVYDFEACAVFVRVLCVWSRVYLKPCIVGFNELVDEVESRLERPKKKYSSRNLLHRRMLSLNPVFGDFVTGLKCGIVEFFFCRVCKRDVIISHGSSELVRHFGSKKQWQQDVVYRLHMGLPIYNKLMEPMTLSSPPDNECGSRLFVDLGPEFPFPADLLPKHSRVHSKVPFVTLDSCFCDWLRSGGDFSLVQRLWGHFLATLGEREPEFTLSGAVPKLR